MGFVRRGDVVLTQDGGIVRIDADAGVMLVVPIATPLHQPTGIAVLPDGDLVIADWALPRMEAGSVVRVRPLDGTVTTLRQGPPLINPFALARGPDGRVVLADIDAGTHVEFPNATLRRGALFDLDPATGALDRRVQDCCEWNPVGMAFLSPTRLLVADAGCCAYSGAGNLATADLETGTWAGLPSPITWRDPFAVVVSDDGGTAYVAESSVVEPGLPAVYAVDLVTGATTLIVEGPPLDAPTGMLLEDAGHLLVADEGARTVFRIDVGTGAVTTVVDGDPITMPAALARVDAGDVVSGVTAATGAHAACSARAAREADQFVNRMLRCAAGEPVALPACVDEALRRWPAHDATTPGCTLCTLENRVRLEPALAAALLRTPGRELACAVGGRHGAGRRIAQAAATLYRERSRCAADFVARHRDPIRLQDCQEATRGSFLVRTAGRCNDTSLGRIAAQVASLADSLLGAWYCAP